MHNHNASESEQMKFRCYGVEKEPDTVKLAKMNLLLNNIRGDITQANSFYSDPYNAAGQFDYVMANPPFNVDEVVVEKVSTMYVSIHMECQETKANQQRRSLIRKKLCLTQTICGLATLRLL